MPVTTTIIYGSKSYENLVLRHTPTAAFGTFASATNTISDMTNKNYLSASLITGASFSSQIPFFALASEQYTFDISSLNKIVIKENSSSYSKALGSGKFASGDEGSEFSVEFLLSKNYNTDSNNDFIKFGIDSGQHTVGISYSNRANEFYLNIYSINGYVRFRSVVFAGQSKLSKHFVINFKNGIPSMYVNGITSKVLFNYLTSQVFFARKISNRTIAEFACETSTEHLLVSMISFYNYCLPERIIRSHYLALFDIGDFKDYIATMGAPILYERVPFSQKIARNDGASQDFFGTNISNTIADFNLQLIDSPNFVPYGLDSSYLDRVSFAGGTGVASTGGFSFKSTDFKDSLSNKQLAITFSGVSTGKYTKENTLISIDNTSVGSIYVGIDSASSKIHIGIGSSSILSSMSSSVSQSSSVTLYISSDNSILSVGYSDESDYIYYDFGSTINYESSIAYLFNRYISSSITGEVSAIGNSEIDFDHAYAGNDEDYKLYLSGSLLNSSSNLIWGMNQKITGLATISIPIPERSQNYFYATDSSDAIVYSLIIDGTASTLTNQSVINIPTTSSNAYLYASLTNYWNGNIYDTSKNVYIQNIALYNFGPASYVAGSFPAILESSVGMLNDPDNYLNVFKQNNIGFIQSSSNVIKIYQSDPNFDNIGQVDFLVAIPNSLTSSSQYLIDISNTASMTLTYSSSFYIINFSGMTASVNGVSAVSGSTRFSPRQHYFVQASFNSGVASNSFMYMFSASNGNSPFVHSFDRLSVFPTTANNARGRYAQIFGRKTISVSDDHQNYLQVQSLPDTNLLLNKHWQVYSS